MGDGDRDFSESPPIDMGSGESEVDFLELLTKRPDPNGAKDVFTPWGLTITDNFPALIGNRSGAAAMIDAGDPTRSDWPETDVCSTSLVVAWSPEAQGAKNRKNSVVCFHEIFLNFHFHDKKN